MGVNTRTVALEVGCWWKAGEIPPDLHKTCDFYLYKRGIFSRRGKLKIVNETSSHDYFWVTHRMSPGEVLTSLAGQKLGEALNQFKNQAKTIELDIEPVKHPQGLVAFLKGVREKLDPAVKLSLATPFVSDKTPSPRSWKSSYFEEIIPLVDGIEVMVYDSGAKTREEYLVYLAENIRAAEDWKKRYPTKKFILGLPAYPDRTSLHRPEVENMKVIAESNLSKSIAGELTLAIYAGWTLNSVDKTAIETLRSIQVNH